MIKYFLEIKNRWILIGITCFSTLITGYLYKELLLCILIKFSIVKNNYFVNFYFIFTSVTEVFSVYLELVKFLVLQSTILYVVCHFIVFISPALFNTELRYLNFLLKIVLVTSLLSLGISNYFVIPFTWNFFLSFQNATVFDLHFEAKLKEYLNFYIILYYGCLFYCQIFVAILYCTHYLNVSPAYIKKFRKLNYYYVMIFSTILSPPELGIHIMLSLIVICIYELLIFVFVLKLILDK